MKKFNNRCPDGRCRSKNIELTERLERSRIQFSNYTCNQCDTSFSVLRNQTRNRRITKDIVRKDHSYRIDKSIKQRRKAS